MVQSQYFGTGENPGPLLAQRCEADMGAGRHHAARFEFFLCGGCIFQMRLQQLDRAVAGGSGSVEHNIEAAERAQRIELHRNRIDRVHL